MAPKHILITRLRFIGDIILTLPVVDNIHHAFPDAEITYMAEYPYTELLYHHPFINHLIEFSTGPRQVKTLYRLISTPFDMAIDLFGNPRSALLAALSGAKRRIGGDYRGRNHLYTDKIRQDPSVKTAIEFHLSYLRPLGIPVSRTDPKLFLLKSEKEYAEHYLIKRGFDLSKPIIGIHPGATWPAKMWPADRFAKLINQILDDLKVQVLLTMGPKDEGTIKQVMDGVRKVIPEPEHLSLRHLSAILSCLDLYIANDCGPIHIAPAVQTRTIGLFGPGEPEIWFPYQKEKGHRFIHEECECSRCHKDFCDNMQCMKAISVEQVMKQIEDSLSI